MPAATFRANFPDVGEAAMKANPPRERYARVPAAALSDTRLSPTEFRVLVALLLHANEHGIVWAKRKTLSAVCGVHPAHISRATAALARYGWIEKTGNGGRSRPAGYQVNAKGLFTCADYAQVNRKTRADSVTKTCADSVTKTRADSARGKEQSIEHTNEQSASRLQALRKQLDRLPYQLEQANPIVASIAEELGIQAHAGQTTHDLAQKLRREIDSKLACNVVPLAIPIREGA